MCICFLRVKTSLHFKLIMQISVSSLTTFLIIFFLSFLKTVWQFPHRLISFTKLYFFFQNCIKNCKPCKCTQNCSFVVLMVLVKVILIKCKIISVERTDWEQVWVLSVKKMQIFVKTGKTVTLECWELEG